MPHPSLKMKPERREKLFAAATREFTEHGFEQASLNRIIGEVGMSKSSFYHYFANKTELFEQIFEQALAPLAQIVSSFEPEALTPENFWPALLSTAQSASSLFVDHPQIFMVGRMFHRNLHEPNGICAAMMQVPLALVSRILEHGKVIGAVRDDLPTSLLIESAMGLGMAVDRWAIDHIEDFSLEEINAFQAKVLGLFVRLLSPEE
jgi:AcrR family transcriptional regulator